jgi:hypothetical protein
VVIGPTIDGEVGRHSLLRVASTNSRKRVCTVVFQPRETVGGD